MNKKDSAAAAAADVTTATAISLSVKHRFQSGKVKQNFAKP